MRGAAPGHAAPSEAAPERSLGLAGSIIKGRYRVNAVSSASRDVVVYAAEELRFGRPITLKVLRDDVAAEAEFVVAVRDQASALVMSTHVDRGLPRVYDCGSTDTGQLFIALEPTKGPTLREVLDARGGLEPSTALRIASQVGEAIETLHHSGIVHGQLGLESVLLVKGNDGTEHVSLVGVELSAAYRTTIGRLRRDALPPAYLAPEQVERGETTAATDQYALGMLVRELLTAGRSPDSATPPLPPEIERIITTALDARPERRFADISVMVNDMWAAQTLLAEPAPAPRPRSVKARTSTPRRHHPRRPRVALRIATAVAAAGIIAVVVWFALSGGMIARVRALVTAPAAPSFPSAARGGAVTLPDRPVTTTSTGEGLGHPAAAPRPAPVVGQPERTAAPVGDGRPPRRAESRTLAEPRAGGIQPATTERDGSAIIDWLLKTRR